MRPEALATGEAVTRTELERLFVNCGRPDTPVTIDVLLDILEKTHVLERPKAGQTREPICPRCNKMRSGWPDDWRWSTACGGYICGLCVVMTERGG